MVMFTGFTLNGMRLGQTGPGSYASLVLIPNFILLIPCAVILLILWSKRPKPGKIPEDIWKKAGIIFAVVLVMLFFNDELWGGYLLRVQVLDAKNKPVPGIVIDTLAQKASWFSVFLPEDLNITVTTDANGIASIRTNRFQSINGLVNARFGPRSGGPTVDPKYQAVNFGVNPVGDGKSHLSIQWDKVGMRPGMDMNVYRSNPFDPRHKILTIFMPEGEGADDLDYDHEAITDARGYREQLDGR